MSKSEIEEDPFSDKSFDQFWLNNVFPDADVLFSVKQTPLNEIKDNCLVALDANVLLLPYEMGAESFSKIAEIYKGLSDADRIFVPAQAAREFVKNRAAKLRDLSKQIADQASNLHFSFYREIGFLEKDEIFKEINEQAEIISGARSKLLEKIRRLRSSLTENIGSDPVSLVYQGLLAKKVISLPDAEKDREKLTQEVKWRYKHKVPPGYKDSNKDDGGIGDFLIWKTILEHGKSQKKDCIFVTKDLKGDWWVQGQGAFQPRVELIEEYYRYTDGRTIHFTSLSSLLETLDVEKKTVTDVKRVEENIVQDEIKKSSQLEIFPHNISRYRSDIGKEYSNYSVNDLISMKNDIDLEISRLHRESRRYKSRLDSEEFLSSADESTILDIYDQDRQLRNSRIELRRKKHGIDRAIGRRSERPAD